MSHSRRREFAGLLFAAPLKASHAFGDLIGGLARVTGPAELSHTYSRRSGLPQAGYGCDSLLPTPGI